jgi:hypothetical protein
MGSAPAKIDISESCQERAQLLREWVQCGRRLVKILYAQSAAVNHTAKSLASFEEQVRLAWAAETEACRKYFGHVNTHDCQYICESGALGAPLLSGHGRHS